MDLKIKDIVDLLQIPEKTLRRWIKDNAIPYHSIHHQYRFNRAEINEWIIDKKPELASRLPHLNPEEGTTSFPELLAKGGIHYDLEGGSVREVLRAAIQAMKTPSGLAKDEILAAVIDRENMMTTAVGHGIAIPHPRNPLVTTVWDARVSLCFLKNPVDFGALDGKPVHALFLLLSENPRRHLEVLSKISFLCQLPEFLGLLEIRAGQNELNAYLEAREQEWRRKGAGR